MSVVGAGATVQPIPFRTRLKAHISIARFDHVTKNVFILPGLLLPLSVDSRLITPELPLKIVLGLTAST